MSTRTAPPAQLPPTELSLTSVTVTFLGDKPKTKIKLTINLDGKDYVIEVAKDSPVQWTGEIRGIAGAKVVVHTQCLHRARRWMGWKDFASAEGTLTEHPSTILDAKQRISVMLTVTPLHEEDARSVGSNVHQDIAPALVHNVPPKDDVPLITSVAEAVTAATETVEKKTVIAEKLGKIWDVLEFLKGIGEPLKEIHPAVGIAITTVTALMELCDKQKACRDAALDLADQFSLFLEIKYHEEPLKKRPETRQAVKYMLESISEASKYICDKTSTGFRGIVSEIFGSEYREKIAGFKKTFVRAKDAFDRSVALTTFAAVDGISLTTQLIFLHEKLLECVNAHFTSDGGCLKDTRADLRQRVKSWIESSDEATPNIFWLYGKAGSGKSTVANTVAAMAKNGGFHLSCFFCKRDDPGLSSPRRLLPTLAYSIAQQHESYRAAITKLLQGPDGAGIATTTDVKTQFEELFEKLLAQTVDPLLPHVVVIDALDECGTSKEQMQLAATILSLSRTAPWIKVFVTSRDEPDIRKIFFKAPDCVSSSINDEAGVDADIRVYINSQANALDIRLSEGDIGKLVKQAEGLFIWCRTLFEYLGGELDSDSLLKEILSGEAGEVQHDSSEPWRELYGLYDKILNSSVGHREENVSFMRTILSIVNVAAPNRPLSAKAITSFLHGQNLYTRYSADTAVKVVKKLHAVLYEDEAANGAVRAHHTSLYDFLGLKAIGASTETGWLTSDGVHQLMVQSCLKTLHEELRFNICEIEIPVLNKDILDLATRISVHISEELQYSCHHWFIHVFSPALAIVDIQHAILELLCSKKLLFWVECMGLLGSLERIRFTFRKLMRPLIQGHPDIMAAVEDTCRVANSFADTMNSVAHIYLSVLWWLPENSLMYRNLGLSKRTSWKLIENKPNHWDALVWRSDQIMVRSVAFSPDGQFVAYGAEDGVVYIRDSQTGTLEGEPLRGHQSAVYSVAYSPDGCFIASCSVDHTVQIWDTKSREASLGPLEGLSDWVRCVAYSPDGLFLASGSYDGTIRIWSTCTGKLQGEPLRHSDWVRAVAYSPDGRFIASACNDGCVHVWDTASHQEASKFQGPQDCVRSVAYSPDGRAIVSGSQDNTIRVWDAKTGEAIGDPLPGHANSVNSVTYSPDGHSILSGSDDGTVRLWDALSGTALSEPLQTHSDGVASVSYSLDGSLIASASNDGVCVWDTSTSFEAGGQSRDPSVQADTRAVYAVAYSPDGRCIASSSGHSDQIRMWNAQTGAVIDTPVLMHAGMNPSGKVRSIAYSRDGRFIVSGSDDKDNSSVCVLDAQTGDTISGPLRGHSATIWSVAYSPDGICVASASQDKTVCLWDVQTGAGIDEPLQVGSPTRSVAFSPDGRVLACGTKKGFIWMWDAHSKAPIRDPIQAHSKQIRLVVFSPDGLYITSTSNDHSVRTWDVQMGESNGPREEYQQDATCTGLSLDLQNFCTSSASRSKISQLL